MFAIFVSPALSAPATEPTCIVVEPGFAIDGVRLGESNPDVVTPANFRPEDNEWWSSVGQTRIRVNSAGVVDLVEHPLAQTDACLTLRVAGQTGQIDLTRPACVEIPFEGCTNGNFDERAAEWWDCGTAGFQIMKDRADGVRVVPASRPPVWKPPPELNADGCDARMTYEPMPTIDGTGIKLPKDTIGMHDSWMGHTGQSLCTPGATPNTIQAAIEAALRRAGYVETRVKDEGPSAPAVCAPDHVWTGHGHTYWFKLLGGPRWEMTTCPRCEWEEERARILEAAPPKP